MSQGRGIRRSIRTVIDQPGLKASIAADVNVVTSGGGRSASSSQSVHIRQRRSDRTSAGDPEPDRPASPHPENEEQS